MPRAAGPLLFAAIGGKPRVCGSEVLGGSSPFETPLGSHHSPETHRIRKVKNRADTHTLYRPSSVRGLNFTCKRFAAKQQNLRKFATKLKGALNFAQNINGV